MKEHLIASLVLMLFFGQACAADREVRVPVEVEHDFSPQTASPFQSILGPLTVTVASDTKPVLLQMKQESGVVKEVALPEVFEQAFDARQYGNKLLLFGWMNPLQAANILILNSETGDLIDEIWAYRRPSVSPNARSIVFLKFFPSHFAYGVESQYRSYVVNESPEFNRAHNGNKDEKVSKVEVGLPIFPLNRSEATRDNVNIPRKLAHFQRSRFFWRADSSKLAFVDEQALEFSLIVVRFDSFGLPLGAKRERLRQPNNICLNGGPTKGCRVISLDEVKLEFDRQGVSAYIVDQVNHTESSWGRISID